MRRTYGLLAVALLSVWQSEIQASIAPIFVPPAGEPKYNNHDPGNPVNLGIVFTPNSDITVDALGFYKGQNTLSVGETVTIFNSSGGVVAQAAVSLSDTLANSYLWKSITPVVLSAGQQYTVDAFTVNNPWSWSDSSAPIVNSLVTYNGTRYLYGGAVGFPINNYPPSLAYYGPNLSVVPEASTLLAGLLMLAPLGLQGIRYLRNPSKG